MVLERVLKESITDAFVKNFFSYYHKSKEIIKNEGINIFISKGFNKIKTLLYATNKATWFYRNLTEFIPEINITDVEISIASQDEFERWLKQHQPEFPWIYVEQEVLATRNDPKLSFVSKINKEIIGFLKVAVKSAYILDYDAHINLLQDVAFIQDTFVLPEYRQKGIAKSMVSKAMIYLKDHGYQKIFCHIPDWNIASIRTYTGLGFKRYGDIRFLRIFKWKIFTGDPEKVVRWNSEDKP